MDFTNDITKIKELLDKATDVLVVTHERPTADSIGSALALSIGLQGLGKKVVVACPDPMTVEFSSFIGVNRVVNELGKKNFIISLDYVEGSIEKVSYNIEGNKFNLVIEPRLGFDAFSPDKVQYSYAGNPAHLIICVDTVHLGGLKKLYEEDKDLYAGKPIINVDRHPNNTHYGHTNMVDPQAASTAEIVARLLDGLGVALKPDIATNLLNAVYSATNNFQNSNVTPASLELAASCLKMGGKRFAVTTTEQEEVPASSGGESVASDLSRMEATVRPAPASGGGTPAAPVKPKVQVGKQPAAPADWLKPKIFKSSNLV